MAILNNNSNIKQIYNQLSDQIVNSYNSIAKTASFNLDKNDVLVSFDAYIQSIIIRALLHKRNFEAGEINFIKNLVKFSDYYKNIGVSKDTYPSKEVEDLLRRESRKITKEVPAVIMMCALIDKELENSIIRSSQTFSTILYSTFKMIINIVLDDPEDEYANRILEPISEFFINNHIEYLR